MKRQRKIVLSLLITLSLQLNYTIQATGVLGENVAVDITQNLSVIQINDPKNGLSH